MIQISSTNGSIAITNEGVTEHLPKGSFFIRRAGDKFRFIPLVPQNLSFSPFIDFSYGEVDPNEPLHSSADELEAQLLALTATHGVHSPHRDAFGRERVSNPKTLWGAKMLYDKTPLFWDEEINGTGTSTYQTNESRVDLSVVTTGDYAIRQSRQRLNYQPGKSQRIEITGTMGAHVANTQKRIGYFNSASTGTFSTVLDGIWFESDGTDIYCVIYKSGTEIIKVAQADWNINKINELDLTKAQIFFIDFEWLGVGGVRFGFIIDQDIRYCHHHAHANVLDGVFMTSPNHSIRYEIRSTGGAATIKQVCSAVSSEGGEDLTGLPHSISTGVVHADLLSTTTVYPLLGIRLQSDKLSQSVILNNLSVLSEAVADFRVVVMFNPTYTGGTPSWSAVTNSSLEGFTVSGTPTITVAEGAWEVALNETFGTNNSTATEILESTIRLGSKIDGTRDEIVIGVMPLGANADINVALNWIEQ